MKCSGLSGLAIALLWIAQQGSAQKSINLHAQMSVSKTDNSTLLLQNAETLLKYAKEQKMETSIQLFLENTRKQIKSFHDAAETVKKQDDANKGTSFTAGKYKLKDMIKLKAKPKKRREMKQVTAEEFKKMMKSKAEITEPLIVKKALDLFPQFTQARQQFTADNLASNAYLEKSLMLDYWPSEAAKTRKIDDTRSAKVPGTKIPFSRWLTLCFLGTFAAPKVPGQATEHCEQTVPASSLVQNLDELDIMRAVDDKNRTLVDNVFLEWEKFTNKFFNSNETMPELEKLVGSDKAPELARSLLGQYRYFVMGPSGSGAKLRAEYGLPFMDILLHGQRRWLVTREEQVDETAKKAKEALEFRETTAYMFFEEKLPELEGEFSFTNYLEGNQEMGDLVFIPPGWWRVTLSLSDTISYYEQLLNHARTAEMIIKQQVWFPQTGQFNLAFCYPHKEILKKTGGTGDAQGDQWLTQAVSQLKNNQYPEPLLSVLSTCAKILGSGGSISKLIDIKKTMCSPDVYSSCRSMLFDKAKTLKKAKDVKLAWLPETIQKPGKAKTEL